MNKRALMLLTVLLALAARAGQPVRFDFEAGDLSGWQIMEGNFGQLDLGQVPLHLCKLSPEISDSRYVREPGNL